MRVQASAVYISLNTVVGGCGPMIVGAILGTSRFSSPGDVRYALLLTVPTAYVASAVAFWVVGLTLRRRAASEALRRDS